MALVHYCDNRSAFEAAIAPLEQMRRTVEDHLAQQATMQGYCCVCDRVNTFTIGPPSAGTWINLRESILCSQCGMNGRSRLTYSVMKQAVDASRAQKIHIMERVTPFFAMAQAKGLVMEGSEYIGPDCAPGSVHTIGANDIRHEDMHNLSYADGALDLFCHFDVLEHVSDYRRALQESARVLRSGGQTVFTVPFYGHEAHQIRAEIVDGALTHHLPPAYHKNPVSDGGSLVFFVPGWPLLDELRELGFSRAQIGLCYDPYQGIVSDNNPHPAWLMWPVIFSATKT
jgi:hypothetical protein